MRTIPKRLVKMGLAAVCGVAAVSLAGLGVVMPVPPTIKYAIYGSAGAAAIFLGQAILPSNEEEA